ncbi:peptide deformylase [Campylobacter pinnipediorum subsp. caledonicus]|uniref:Peptide deformylase n=1 Tax=Campylobacter pinnipediorum subsp. caledonicus TaxID=1874362 RepID=A0A1S6U5A6_9BACT|nr:peptide deformylase [Campylobacter pinnipediorum]AQW85317.1 peptide deformylase [Campylobacter pinnipediorum subsp. caledonicus]AQW86926.1 peptide deformylase [Campylobacter pinnipediorum subsp. caledonicus]OPA71918.1 peptide deformylase [Campylobacter pinnipediorum subsp. caledonicus]
MILEVLSYPNKKLYEVSKEVTEFDDKLHKFLDDMYDTMIAKLGIGLAAIQVGVAKRIFIINLVNEDGIQDKNELIEVINPVFEDKKGESIFQEGCLSVPDFYEEVKRAEWIKVSYQDRFGIHHSIEADGLLAIAFQHENDHLDGHLFIEKIGFTKRKKFDKEFKSGKKQKPKESS